MSRVSINLNKETHPAMSTVTREDILALAGADTLANAAAENLVGQFRSNFENGFGEALPEAPTKALAVVEDALKKSRRDLDDALFLAYSETLEPEHLAAIVQFHKTPAGQALNAAAGSVQLRVLSATDAWCEKALKSVEDELAKILG